MSFLTAVRSWVWAAGFGALLAACASTAEFTSSGFVQRTYGYSLRFDDAQAQTFMGPDWKLDNYQLKKGKYKEKTGSEYWATRQIDWDRDGNITRYEEAQESVFDLRFTHASDNGIVWIKAHPIHPDTTKRRLDVLLDQYADALAGTGLYTQANLFSIGRTTERKFVTFLTDVQSVMVQGLPGVAGTIEAAEVEKFQTDPTHRDWKVRLHVARFKHLAPKPVKPSKITTFPVVERDGKKYLEQTGLLFIGYYNKASDFPRHLDEVAALIRRLDVAEMIALDTPAEVEEVVKNENSKQSSSPPAAASSGSASPAASANPAPAAPAAP